MLGFIVLAEKLLDCPSLLFNGVEQITDFIVEFLVFRICCAGECFDGKIASRIMGIPTFFFMIIIATYKILSVISIGLPAIQALILAVHGRVLETASRIQSPDTALFTGAYRRVRDEGDDNTLQEPPGLIEFVGAGGEGDDTVGVGGLHLSSEVGYIMAVRKPELFGANGGEF